MTDLMCVWEKERVVVHHLQEIPGTEWSQLDMWGQFVNMWNEVDESFVKVYYPFAFQDSDNLRLAKRVWFDEVQDFTVLKFLRSFDLCVYL